MSCCECWQTSADHLGSFRGSCAFVVAPGCSCSGTTSPSLLATAAGAVTFVIQFAVFVGLLFFLLDLPTDPLTMAVQLLPVSEQAQV